MIYIEMKIKIHKRKFKSKHLDEKRADMFDHLKSSGQVQNGDVSAALS